MNKSHLTAITRRSVSAPVRYIANNFDCSGKVLDYGCGKGFDADYFGFDKYDPYFFPDEVKPGYDIIICNYVFNVIKQDEQQELLITLKSLLNKNGTCFITVRRDVIKEGYTSRGTYQTNAVLDLPVFYENKNHFIIYIWVDKII